MKQKLLEYIENDGVVHSLDMASTAKAAFIQRFHDVVLAPRGMAHKMLFPGPTGTNSVESAIKMARNVTGRTPIVRSEEHTSELQSLMRNSYAVFCLKKKKS